MRQSECDKEQKADKIRQQKVDISLKKDDTKQGRESVDRVILTGGFLSNDI